MLWQHADRAGEGLAVHAMHVDVVKQHTAALRRQNAREGRQQR